MNVASLELCKELYELSGWNAPHDKVYIVNDSLPSDSGYKKPHHFKALGYGKRSGVITYYPAYDLGYLLRKLPRYVEERSLVVDPIAFEQWRAAYITDDGLFALKGFAATPEDAAAKLAIGLFKQGILNRDPVTSSSRRQERQ